MELQEFLEKAKKIYENKYDYSEVKDVNHGPVMIHCERHGLFFDDAYSHLKGYGCPKCHAEMLKKVLKND